MSGSPTDFVYGPARYLIGTAQLDLLTAPINAMLVNALYIPTTGDQYVSDIPPGAVVVRDVALTGLALNANGVFSGNIPQFSSLVSPYLVVAVVLYSLEMTDDASPLIYYSSTGPGFPFTPNGFTYFVGYDASNGGWFQA